MIYVVVHPIGQLLAPFYKSNCMFVYKSTTNHFLMKKQQNHQNQNKLHQKSWSNMFARIKAPERRFPKHEYLDNDDDKSENITTNEEKESHQS